MLETKKLFNRCFGLFPGNDLLGFMAKCTKIYWKGMAFRIVYWDYVLGILIMSIITAITLGSLGTSGRSFINDIGQASFKYLVYCIFAGTIWNLGTLLQKRAIAIAGMTTVKLNHNYSFNSLTNTK
jgi:hypothetical protein